MPKRPLKPCAYPGCPELVENHARFCLQHTRAEYRAHDTRRGTPTERGYSYRWRKYTEHYKKNNPLCVECKKQGKITPVYCVDHIIPISGPDDPLFWDANNHQSLCESCHNKKTAKEKGWGRGAEGLPKNTG
jgi:5-methylcytosine-specific restriction enzyme A